MKRLTPGGASHRFANEMGYPACQCISRGQVCQTASQGKRLSQWLGRLADSTRPAGSEDVSFHQKFGAIRGQVRNIDRQSRGDCARSMKVQNQGELRNADFGLRSGEDRSVVRFPAVGCANSSKAVSPWHKLKRQTKPFRRKALENKRLIARLPYLEYWVRDQELPRDSTSRGL